MCDNATRQFNLVVLLTKRGAFAVEQTPLHFAAKAGQLEVAQFLVDNGADVNARTHHDETPLMEAVDHGHDAVAELLLKNKADVNAVTVSGKTALHGAHTASPCLRTPTYNISLACGLMRMSRPQVRRLRAVISWFVVW